MWSVYPAAAMLPRRAPSAGRWTALLRVSGSGGCPATAPAHPRTRAVRQALPPPRSRRQRRRRRHRRSNRTRLCHRPTESLDGQRNGKPPYFPDPGPVARIYARTGRAHIIPIPPTTRHGRSANVQTGRRARSARLPRRHTAASQAQPHHPRRWPPSYRRASPSPTSRSPSDTPSRVTTASRRP